LLLAPTLYQAFTSGHELLYGAIVGVEALVVIGLGVGLRARLLVMVGAAFLGVAAIRGAMLAVSEGVPVAVIFGAFAVLLLGGALWLSLRQRREQGVLGDEKTRRPDAPDAEATS
jgi:hypothetical protein